MREALIEIARQAGAEILSIYHTADFGVEQRRVFEHAGHILNFGRVPLVKVFTGERIRVFEHLRHGRDRGNVPIANAAVERGESVVAVR